MELRVGLEPTILVLQTRALTTWLPKLGGPVGIQTRDPLIKSQVLYQLSYRPLSVVGSGRIELTLSGFTDQHLKPLD